jgi:hypothetical protein
MRCDLIHMLLFPILLSLSISIESASSPFKLDLYSRLQAIEMSSEFHSWAISGNLVSGANIEDTAEDGMTVLSCASEYGRFEVVVYLVERSVERTPHTVAVEA